jgi:hypothetical protein
MDTTQELGVGQHRQRILETLEIVDVEGDRGGLVFGDDDPSVFAFEALDDLGQAVLSPAFGPTKRFRRNRGRGRASD